MARPTTPQEALDQAITGPKQVTVSQNSHTVVGRDPAELAEQVDRAKANTAGGKKGFGLRMQKLVPPGGG